MEPSLPVAVDEGGAAVLAAAAAGDAEGGTLIYAWDLDQDGNYETGGQTVTFSAADLDGPSQLTVGVRVTDAGGLSAEAVVPVTVLNVPPTADFVASSGAIDEGGSIILSFINAGDAGEADLGAGFSYSLGCESDGVYEVADASASSHVCGYADNGTYSISKT